MLQAIAPPTDRVLFADLVDRYEREIFAFLLRMVRHEADAQDLLQETFLRALRAYPRLLPEFE